MSGLFAPPAVSSRMPPQVGIEDELAAVTKAMKRSIDMGTVSKLARAMQVSEGGEGATAPQPATVQDVVTLSKEAREAAAEQTRLHRDAYHDEREARMAAEQQAEGAFEAGHSEASKMADKMLEIQDRHNAAMLEMVKENKRAEAEAKETSYKAQVDAIAAKLDAALAAKDRDIADARAKAEEAERKAAALA
ncbi:MAG: hypothetical protein ACYCU5_16310, partial [Actinomycetes bacterium]